VDGSDSVGASNYQLQLEFLKKLGAELDLGPSSTRAAMVSYTIGDGESITEFYFTDDYNTYINEIDQVQYAAGFTLTGHAINHAINDVVPHSRPGAQVSIIVVTDGNSYDDVLAPSNLARGDNINMYAIGIKDYTMSQLQQISSLPYSDFLYTVNSFSKLDEIIDDIKRPLCAL